MKNDSDAILDSIRTHLIFFRSAVWELSCLETETQRLYAGRGKGESEKQIISLMSSDLSV